MAESYTTLKGFNSITDVDIQTAIQSNIIGFFDWGFINKGGFVNIRLSETDIRSSDRSVLKPVQDPNSTGSTKIWAAYRQNLVWESGLYTATQPVQISGVWVNGAFKTPTSPGYQHYVDYKNGQVVFSSAVPANSVVKMEYSSKTVLFTDLNVVPILNELQFRSTDLSDLNYSSRSGDWAILSRSKVQMPLVSVEISPRVKYEPIELGGVNQWVYVDVLMHVLTEDMPTAMRYSSFIAAQVDKTIFMYDLGMMAASGAIPLDYRGAKITNPKTYPYLIDLSSNGGYRFNKLEFREASISGPYPVGTLYHSIVRFTTRATSIY